MILVMKISDLKPPKPYATSDDFEKPLTLTVKGVRKDTIPNFTTKKDEVFPILIVDGGIQPIKVTIPLKKDLLRAFGDVELVGLRMLVSRRSNKFNSWSITIAAAPTDKPAPTDTPVPVITSDEFIAQFDKFDKPADVQENLRAAWMASLKALYANANALRKTEGLEPLALGATGTASHKILEEYVNTLRAKVSPPGESEGHE